MLPNIKIGEDCSDSSEFVPRLDRWLASQLLKAMKGVPETAISCSGLHRRLYQRGSSSRSRVILFYGFSSTSILIALGVHCSHLKSIFQVELSGYSTANLREFSSRVMYVLNSIPQEDWPNRRMLGEWLFHRLKQVRKLERFMMSSRGPHQIPTKEILTIFGIICRVFG